MTDPETRRAIARLSDAELLLWPDDGLLSHSQRCRRRELIVEQRRHRYSWAEQQAAEQIRDEIAAREIADTTNAA